MQDEIEQFNLNFLETWTLIYMLKLPSLHFGQNVFLKGVKIQVLNQFGIQVLNKNFGSNVEQIRFLSQFRFKS